MANDPKSIAKKVVGGNGVQTPQAIANQLSASIGKPIDISKTKTPLRMSGDVLPPMTVKGKK